MNTAARGIRGATVVLSNTEADIKQATTELLSEIIKKNNIEISDIAFTIFTLTRDLNAAFPAKFARLDCGFDMVPMMCYQELDVPGSIEKCLRVLIVINTELKQNEINHVYLKGAKALRADLNQNAH